MAVQIFPMAKLEQLPINLDATAIEAAIEPFKIADGENNRRWHSLVIRRRKTALRRLVVRVLGGWVGSGRRDRGAIESEYTDAWSAGHTKYDPSKAQLRAAPWLWGERRLLLDGGAASRLRSLLFAAVIDQYRPRCVLEVGSGNGINLLTLAGAYPDISFTGIELGPGWNRRGAAGPKGAGAAARAGGLYRAAAKGCVGLPTRRIHPRGRYSHAIRGELMRPGEDSAAVEQMERVPPSGIGRNRARLRQASVDAGAVPRRQCHRPAPSLRGQPQLFAARSTNCATLD